MSLQGRAAIITGAGSGMGRSIALRLAQDGAAVLCADLNLAGAEETIKEVEKLGGKALAYRVDVSKKPEVEGMVNAAVKNFGSLDILVNAAGIWEGTPAEEIPEEEWDRILGVNLKGLFFCCQAASPVMKERRAGRIINIASIAGRTGGSYCGAHYTASKGGVIALTKRLAKEWAQYRITVNTVNPGPTDTAMTADWPAEIKERIKANIPLGRFVQAEDIAEAVAFLASDAARFITGEAIEVNGGILMD
ncbi:MAG: SDR family oxidoreductase [candidate division NC10 bacterium]|nr:SDR family oxidoreductase [candidate division NC10 bacterium]